MYTHAHIYSHTFYKHKLLRSFSIAHMGLGLPSWDWLVREDWLSLSYQPLIAHSSPSRLKPGGTSPIYIGIVVFKALFRWSYLGDVLSAACHIYRRHCLSADIVSWSLSYDVPRALGTGLCCQWISWDWLAYSQFSAFWQVWPSVMGSECCKRLLWWGVRAPLICG